MRTSRRQPVDWLFPPVRKRVLALLLTSLGRRWHLRDIARRTGSAVNAVRRELDGLAGVEILRRIRDGNRVYYEANPASPVYPELSALLRKTTGLGDVIRAALAPLQEKIDVALIYGSQANGTAKAESDVDVLVVGRVGFADVVAALGPAQDEIGREINPTVYPPAEFRRKLAARHHFLRTVLKGPSIFLVGDRRELARLGKHRLAVHAPDQPAGDR